MKLDTYQKFQNFMVDLKQKRTDIEKQIEDNMWKQIEANSCIEEILNREEEDFKVFSPRKIEDIYKDELQEYQSRKTVCEKENQSLQLEKQKIESVLLVLEDVENEISKPSGDDINKYVETLDMLNHKVELGINFIQQDAVRAKQEFQNINNELREVIQNLKCFT